MWQLQVHVSASHTEQRFADHHLICEVCQKHSSLLSPPWFPFALFAHHPAQSPISNLNWLWKADGRGRPLVARWVATSEVMFSQAAGREMEQSGGVSPQCGLCCHLVAETVIASVSHMSHKRCVRCFNDLKDNVPPTQVYTDKTLLKKRTLKRFERYQDIIVNFKLWFWDFWI